MLVQLQSWTQNKNTRKGAFILCPGRKQIVLLPSGVEKRSDAEGERAGVASTYDLRRYDEQSLVTRDQLRSLIWSNIVGDL